MTLAIDAEKSTLTAWHRLTGILGLIGAAILAFNAARVAGLFPTNDITHLLAPFAPLLGLVALIGLASYQRASLGRFGAVAFVVNVAGLAGAFAIEFVLHGVFPALEDGAIDALVEGRTGTAFLLASVVVMTGVILFGIASWRTGLLPRWAIAAYALGLTLGSLRMLPEPVFLTGLFAAAVGIAGMSWVLARSAGQPAN